MITSKLIVDMVQIGEVTSDTCNILLLPVGAVAK